jgi:hypothetical protein
MFIFIEAILHTRYELYKEFRQVWISCQADIPKTKNIGDRLGSASIPAEPPVQLFKSINLTLRLATHKKHKKPASIPKQRGDKLHCQW